MRADESIRRRCAGAALLAALCAAVAWSRAATPLQSAEMNRSERRGGWIASGTTVPIPRGRTGGGRAPSGVLDAFAPAMKIRALLSANDTVWIGTEGGLFAYSPEADTLLAVAGVRCGPVSTVAMRDDGALWVGGSGGLSVRSDGTWTHYGRAQNSLFSRVTEIAPGDGGIWIGTYGNGCARVTEDSMTVYTRADSLLDDRVLAIGEESASVVWFGTASGLCRADEQSWQSMRYGSGIPIGAVEDILFNETGDVFCGVARRGVVRFSFGRVRAFGPREGLPGWEIHALSLGPGGSVWAAGAGGVSRFDGSGWVPLRLPELPLAGYRFLSICHDIEGRCFLGSDAGVMIVLSREHARSVPIPQRFPDAQVKKIRSFNGDLWMLTERRLYRFRRGLEEFVPPGEWCIGAMSDFCVDDGGTVWVATRFGILRFTGETWELFDRRQGLPTDHFVTAVRGGSGDVWFGTYDRGVLRYTAGGWVHYAGAAAPPDDRIEEMTVDGAGVVWAVVGEGELARLVGDAWERVSVPRPRRGGAARKGEEADSTMALDPAITFLDDRSAHGTDGVRAADLHLGLDAQGRCVVAAPEGVYRPAGSEWRVIGTPSRGGPIDPTAVVVTRAGRLWLGTRRNGVYVHEGDAWLHLGTEDGLTDDHILTIAEDDDGAVWIGTGYGGLNRFTPEKTL